MDGMRTGSPRMSSSGWLLAVAVPIFAWASIGVFSIIYTFFCRCRYMALLVVSVVCYIATFSFSGLLFHWFTPSGHDCGLNLFFIVFTLILVFAFAIVALHPKVPSCSLFFFLLLILPMFILLDSTRNYCLISYTGCVWGFGQYYICTVDDSWVGLIVLDFTSWSSVENDHALQKLLLYISIKCYYLFCAK